MNVRLRPATPDDSDAIYDITTSVHLGDVYKSLIPPSEYDRFRTRYLPNDERRDRYRQKLNMRLSDPSWKLWVAECDGEVCGFRIIRQTPEALELHGLFVSENYQGQGIGRQLFETWRQYARPYIPATLEVLEGNTRAINLYKSEGFIPVTSPDKRFYGARLLRMIK